MILYLVPNKVIQGFSFSGAVCNIYSILCCFVSKKQASGMHSMHWYALQEILGNIMQKNMIESLLHSELHSDKFFEQRFLNPVTKNLSTLLSER